MERLEERRGQQRQGKAGWLKGTSGNGSSRELADLSQFKLLRVTNPHGINVSAIYCQHSAITIARAGEVILPHMQTEQGRSVLFAWLQKQTSTRMRKSFVIRIADQKANDASFAFKLDFAEGAEPFDLKPERRSSAYLEKGELLLVQEGFRPFAGVDLA